MRPKKMKTTAMYEIGKHTADFLELPLLSRVSVATKSMGCKRKRNVTPRMTFHWHGVPEPVPDTLIKTKKGRTNVE